jgi:hypothetical protein
LGRKIGLKTRKIGPKPPEIGKIPEKQAENGRSSAFPAGFWHFRGRNGILCVIFGSGYAIFA